MTSEHFSYDLFLSHSSDDKAVVRPLAERLRRDGLKVWFDEWELRPGDSIPAKIEEGLEHSRVLVLCMSANAFGSDWAQLESQTFRFRDPLNKGRRFIPLRLDDAPVKGSLAQFLYINWQPAKREQEYAKLFEACCLPTVMAQLSGIITNTVDTPSSISKPVNRIDHSSYETTKAGRIPCELPPLAEHFTGRDKELKQLTDRLLAGLNTAVIGPAGLGKTALAAAALREIIGTNGAALAETPFPDGILYIDLYSLHGKAEPAWNAIANRLQGYGFLNNAPARDRAAEACRASRVIVIIEGGEEADGMEERTTIPELLGVLSPECRHLLLTRLSTQSAASESVELRETLHPDEAARLLDALTANRPLDTAIRQSVLELLEGHPLAINWAGNLLARNDEEPSELINAWKKEGLPLLSDPRQAERTLHWLFERSIRGLDATGWLMLTAAGLLAPIPFPLESMAAAAAFAGTDQTGNSQIREALRNLVQRGLLHRAQSGNWRFSHVLAYRFARNTQSPEADLTDRLARWLNDTLAETLNPSGNDNGLQTTARLLQHAGALLRADSAHALWMPLTNSLLYTFADRFEEMGRLDLVTDALSTVASWLETLPVEVREDSNWLREYCVLIVDRGNVLRDKGDLDGALKAFNASLDVRIRLAGADPSNATWQRDLSYTLTMLALIFEQQGKPEQALPLAEESLSIDERLSALAPSSVTWQRDVKVSRNMVRRLHEATRPPEEP
jgi:tetratricopeptide (TPR) repeat protein